MTSNVVYFRPDVVTEPLFNQWYAWAYLISPITAAMYIANSHLKIMRSFVSAPEVHVAALKNSAMLGGPFLDYDAGKVPEIKALINKTVEEQPHMLELAEAIKTLDEILQREAEGHSLESLYKRVPDVLKGYVELVYDLNNHPSIRFIEGFMYHSPYYNPSSQSITLYLNNGEERRFAFSSPRLIDDEHLHLRMPFDSPALDELFKMKETPQPLAYIKSLLGVEDEADDLFSSFFTSDPPPSRERYESDDIRIRYYGHACVLIETKEISILCDPVISYYEETGIERYTYADLPEQIDHVLITHNHQDHCMFETLLQLRHKINNIIVPRSNGGGLVDPSLKLILKAIGFANVYEIDEAENIEVKGGSILGVPFLGEHGDLSIRSKIAYLITLHRRSVLLAADSNNIEPRLYDHMHDIARDVDIIFLGMECEGAPLTWLYGPLLTRPMSRKMDQSRRFDGSNCDKGLDLIKRLNPKQVYVYAMGQEPWLTYLTSIQYTEQSRAIVESKKLGDHCRTQGLVTERLYGQKEIILPLGTSEARADAVGRPTQMPVSLHA
jgi:L-ascorbate metabolism protein UlaG (beta-lactamase superfamily)